MAAPILASPRAARPVAVGGSAPMRAQVPVLLAGPPAQQQVAPAALPLNQGRPAGVAARRSVAAAASATATAPAAGMPRYTTPESMPALELSLPYRVEFGQVIKVVGSGPAFGDWSTDDALLLKWSEGDVWRGQLRMPPGAYEFKFVVYSVDPRMVVRWEDGANRSLTVPATQGKVVVECAWGNPAGMTTEVKAAGKAAAGAVAKAPRFATNEAFSPGKARPGSDDGSGAAVGGLVDGASLSGSRWSSLFAQLSTSDGDDFPEAIEAKPTKSSKFSKFRDDDEEDGPTASAEQASSKATTEKYSALMRAADKVTSSERLSSRVANFLGEDSARRSSAPLDASAVLRGTGMPARPVPPGAKPVAPIKKTWKDLNQDMDMKSSSSSSSKASVAAPYGAARPDPTKPRVPSGVAGPAGAFALPKKASAMNMPSKQAMTGASRASLTGSTFTGGSWRTTGLDAQTWAGLAAATAVAGAAAAAVMSVASDPAMSAQVTAAGKAAKQQLMPVQDGVVTMQKAVQGGWRQVEGTATGVQKTFASQWAQAEKQINSMLLPGLKEKPKPPPKKPVMRIINVPQPGQPIPTIDVKKATATGAAAAAATAANAAKAETAAAQGGAAQVFAQRAAEAAAQRNAAGGGQQFTITSGGGAATAGACTCTCACANPGTANASVAK